MTHATTSDLYQRDDRGRTPLFHAAEQGRLDLIKAMLARLPGTGFYPQRLGYLEITDQDGLTAADVAEQSGQAEIAAFLRYEAWRIATFG
jgi:ankyrin repeat protein